MQTTAFVYLIGKVSLGILGIMSIDSDTSLKGQVLAFSPRLIISALIHELQRIGKIAITSHMSILLKMINSPCLLPIHLARSWSRFLGIFCRWRGVFEKIGKLFNKMNDRKLVSLFLNVCASTWLLCHWRAFVWLPAAISLLFEETACFLDCLVEFWLNNNSKLQFII